MILFIYRAGSREAVGDLRLGDGHLAGQGRGAVSAIAGAGGEGAAGKRAS